MGNVDDSVWWVSIGLDGFHGCVLLVLLWVCLLECTMVVAVALMCAFMLVRVVVYLGIDVGVKRGA